MAGPPMIVRPEQRGREKFSIGCESKILNITELDCLQPESESLDCGTFPIIQSAFANIGSLREIYKETVRDICPTILGSEG